MARRCKAMNVMWEKVEVLGKEGLYSSLRVDKDTIPNGWHFYEVRHDDNDWCEPIEIALGVLVNHFGTLITKEPLPLEQSTNTDNAYLYIDPDKDWKYLCANVFMVGESH